MAMPIAIKKLALNQTSRTLRDTIAIRLPLHFGGSNIELAVTDGSHGQGGDRESLPRSVPDIWSILLTSEKLTDGPPRK